MKKIVQFSLIIIFTTGVAQTTELKLASDIWPPFTNIEGEKSIAKELVNEALRRQNIEVTTGILLDDEVLSRVDSHDFDGSAALWVSEERKENYLFSNPYLNNQLVLIGRKGSDVSATSMMDLTGKRLGVIENYAYGDINATQHIILVYGKTNQQNLEKLLSGTLDYMLVDALLIQYM